MLAGGLASRPGHTKGTRLGWQQAAPIPPAPPTRPTWVGHVCPGGPGSVSSQSQTATNVWSPSFSQNKDKEPRQSDISRFGHMVFHSCATPCDSLRCPSQTLGDPMLSGRECSWALGPLRTPSQAACQLPLLPSAPEPRAPHRQLRGPAPQAALPPRRPRRFNGQPVNRPAETVRFCAECADTGLTGHQAPSFYLYNFSSGLRQLLTGRDLLLLPKQGQQNVRWAATGPAGSPALSTSVSSSQGIPSTESIHSRHPHPPGRPHAYLEPPPTEQPW